MELDEKMIYENLGVVDREREFKQILYALLTKEHVMMHGNAGTGKSHLANNIFKTIGGASVFSVHMTKFMSEESIFGPLDIKKLRDDSEMVYKIEHGALTKDFLFLDEFFDASDSLLRSLLGILNEREWKKGSQYVKSPLHTAICTSNYTRENEVTGAIMDRFIFKMNVLPISKAKEIGLYSLKNSAPKELLSLEDIKGMSNDVMSDKIQIDSSVISKMIDLRREYQKATKRYISDRTALKTLKLMRASALLSGRKKVTEDDLAELSYMFCTLNERLHENLFSSCFKKIVEKESALKEMTEIYSSAEKFLYSFPDAETLSTQDFVDKMKQLNAHLGRVMNTAPPTQVLSARKAALAEKAKYILQKNKDAFILNHSN